ncbi:sentrin sumo-specific protease [Diaporthe amygdali]|uniref:sentrin sumo-specific protease n=1 Tax=Phomopsis amygdali TaxID=1214568 RepID=UPI0022FE46D5|nr:sentrin sumo-specific protease [Diaporthe amygdali]KAJ0125519.1 sentrin sumo-specific protease [Diaporthe amygdali]
MSFPQKRKAEAEPDIEDVIMRDVANDAAVEQTTYFSRFVNFGANIRNGIVDAVKGACTRAVGSVFAHGNRLMHSIVEVRHSTADGLSVKRFKRLPLNPKKAATKGILKNTLPVNYLKALPNGQYCWTNRVREHLGVQNHLLVDAFFSNLMSIVRAERVEDYLDIDYAIDPLNVPDFVVDRLRASGNDPTLSILVHNYYIHTTDKRNPHAFVDAGKTFFDKLNKLAKIYRLVYNGQGRVPFLKDLGFEPYDNLETDDKNGLLSHRERLHYYECVVFLQYILTQRAAFNQMCPVQTIAGIIVDFDALHKDEAPPSYVDWPGKYQRVPGAFPGDEMDSLLFDDVALNDFEPARLYDHLNPSPRKFETYDTPPRNAMPKNPIYFDQRGFPKPRRGALRNRLLLGRPKKSARFKQSPQHWYMPSDNEPVKRVYPEGTQPRKAETQISPKSEKESVEDTIRRLKERNGSVFSILDSHKGDKIVYKQHKTLDELFDDDPLGFEGTNQDLVKLSREKRDDFDTRKQLINEAFYQLEAEQRAEERRVAEEAQRAAEEARRRAEEERLRAEEEEVRRVEEAGGLRQPHKPVVPSLTDEWIARSQGTLHARLNAELAKTPEGTPLTRKDFETVVTPNQWLNDEIVNGTLLHLANYINQKAGIKNTRVQTPKVQVFNSFFGKKIYDNGGEGTERQMRRTGIRKDTFLEIEAVLIPICRGAHWTLVVVRPKYRQVHHFDSLNGAGNSNLTDNALKWVRMVLEDRFVPSEWNTTTIPSPRQHNFDDCGVHTVTNGICVAMHVDPMTYSADDMNQQRLHIAAVLLNDGFKGDLSLDDF